MAIIQNSPDYHPIRVKALKIGTKVHNGVPEMFALVNPLSLLDAIAGKVGMFNNLPKIDSEVYRNVCQKVCGKMDNLIRGTPHRIAVVYFSTFEVLSTYPSEIFLNIEDATYKLGIWADLYEDVAEGRYSDREDDPLWHKDADFMEFKNVVFKACESMTSLDGKHIVFDH